MTLADWIRFYVTIGAIGVLLGIEGLTAEQLRRLRDGGLAVQVFTVVMTLIALPAYAVFYIVRRMIR